MGMSLGSAVGNTLQSLEVIFNRERRDTIDFSAAIQFLVELVHGCPHLQRLEFRDTFTMTNSRFAQFSALASNYVHDIKSLFITTVGKWDDFSCMTPWQSLKNLSIRSGDRMFMMDREVSALIQCCNSSSLQLLSLSPERSRPQTLPSHIHFQPFNW